MIFDKGDRAYIVENNMNVAEVEIMRVDGDLYTIRLGKYAQIRLRHGRLYPTKEAAEKAIVPLGHLNEESLDSTGDERISETSAFSDGNSQNPVKKKLRSPYDYWH